jgi:group I intron endonuclease
MQSDFNELGEDSFVIFVLEEIKTNDRDLLFSREQYWMNKYSPEYNVSKYAGHYICMNESSARKSADSRRGRNQSQEEKDKRASSLKKFWATHPAKVISKEMREHLSKINMGKNNPNWGRKRTPEQLKRQSEGRANTVYTFKSPEGDTVSFRRITESPTPLSYSTLRKLVRGILKESMGWTFVKAEPFKNDV